MTASPLAWPDTAHEAIKGDLTVAVAYLTPAGGAVITSVSPLGITDQARGEVSFTTSLAWPKKLERILRNPRVSLAYHTREHGFATHSNYVLVQGNASVDLQPSEQRLAQMLDTSEPFLGKVKRGKGWDWLLHEYYLKRAFIDIEVERIATWPDLAAAGPMTVAGPSWPQAPAEQQPPKNGTAPRTDAPALVRRIADLPHRLLAYQGSDGYPVIVPVTVTGHDETGLRLTAPAGLLPPGGRRAGFLAHSYQYQCVGLSMRTLTGWLTVSDEGALYAPHTSKGMAVPSNGLAVALGSGLSAKHGFRQARRSGMIDGLRQLAAQRTDPVK